MNQIGSLLNLCIGLVMLWLTYYFGWRTYRIDNVRHDLFELRNELFIYAAQGGISVDNDAYKSLRRRIEALIRFAHTMSLSRIVIIGLQLKKGPLPALETRQQQWQSALEDLPESSQAKLRDIHDRVTLRIMVQVVTGNVALLALIFLCIPIMALTSFFRSQPKQDGALKVAKDLRVDLIEEQAVLAQECGLAAA